MTLPESAWTWIFDAPVAGSFAVTFAVRSLQDRSILTARSCCDGCGKPLGVASLIPIFSWMALAGRSRCCGTRIPVLYTIIEASFLCVTLLAFFAAKDSQVEITILLGWFLLTLTVFDLRARRLPYFMTLPLAISGIMLGWFYGRDEALARLLGFLAGGAALYGIALACRSLRKRGLGLEQAALFAGCGAWVKLEGLPSILIASLCVIFYGFVLYRSSRRNTSAPALPFGSAFCLGLWVTYLCGPLPFGSDVF